jgi:hypothetical protein
LLAHSANFVAAEIARKLANVDAVDFMSRTIQAHAGRQNP